MNKISYSNLSKRRPLILLLGLTLMFGLILGSGGLAPSWAAPGQNPSQQTVPPRETETPEPPTPAPTEVPPAPGNDEEEGGERPGTLPEEEAPAGVNPEPGDLPALPPQAVEPEEGPDQPTRASGSEANSGPPQAAPDEAGDSGEGENIEGVRPQADLQLSLSASHISLQPAEIITFTLTISNLGPAAATGVRIRERLPVQLALNSALPGQGRYDFGTETWMIDTLLPNQQLTLNLVARTIVAGVVTNTAEIIVTNEPDPDSVPGNALEYEDDQASLSILIISETASASKEGTVTDSTAGRVSSTWRKISAGSNLLWLYALIFGVILFISGLVLVRRS